MAKYTQIAIKGGQLDGKLIRVEQQGSLYGFNVDVSKKDVGITADDFTALINKAEGVRGKSIGIAGAIATATVISEVVNDQEVTYLEPNSIHGMGVSDEAISKGHFLPGQVVRTGSTDVFQVTLGYPSHETFMSAYGETSGNTDPLRPTAVKPMLSDERADESKFKNLLDAVSEAAKLAS